MGGEGREVYHIHEGARPLPSCLREAVEEEERGWGHLLLGVIIYLDVTSDRTNCDPYRTCSLSLFSLLFFVLHHCVFLFPIT